VEEMVADTPLYIIILVAVIIGPIVEELIFRKILMDKLGAYGDRVAILVSAIAFGVFHGNLSQMFYATAIGATLAYVYSKTGKLRYPIIIHMVINFLGSVVGIILTDSMVKLEELMLKVGEDESLMLENMDEYLRLISIAGPLSMISLALPILGIIFFFKKKNQFFVSDRCEVFIPKNKRSSVIMLNVGAILFLVLCAITIGLNIIAPLLDAVAAV
jgi:membrane protease YdiL (CAAX protease family)